MYFWENYCLKVYDFIDQGRIAWSDGCGKPFIKTYCFKIFIFQSQFNQSNFLTTKTEMKGLSIIYCFIIKCYVEILFKSNAIEALYNEILLFFKLECYKVNDKQVDKLAI